MEKKYSNLPAASLYRDSGYIGFSEDDPALINEFDPKVDPLWYILRKEEISFERTRRVSERAKEK